MTCREKNFAFTLKRSVIVTEIWIQSYYRFSLEEELEVKLRFHYVDKIIDTSAMTLIILVKVTLWPCDLTSKLVMLL
jgi:hypothetical protein